MQMDLIKTERLTLRAIEPTDEDDLFELHTDPEVMRYLTDGEPHSPEMVKTVMRVIEALATRHNGRFGYWAAIETKTNTFMGWFHFRPAYDDPQNCRTIELGYRLKPAFWGQGFATEGSKALIERGFQELGVDEVVATTMKNNIASRRVMEKAGLRFVEEFVDARFPGTTELDVRYALRRDAS